MAPAGKSSIALMAGGAAEPSLMRRLGLVFCLAAAPAGACEFHGAGYDYTGLGYGYMGPGHDVAAPAPGDEGGSEALSAEPPAERIARLRAALIARTGLAPPPAPPAEPPELSAVR